MSEITLLKGCPLFYELYDKEIESIIKHCNVATFEEGDYIVRQGEEGSDIFIILVGQANVLIHKNNKTVNVATLEKGDVFGELVLINQTQRAADIKCSCLTDVLIINYDTIFDLYKKNTKIFAVLLLNLARLLTKRLQKANQTIEVISKNIDD